MRYVATCRFCDLQVAVDNQPALELVIDRLEQTNGCTLDRGHQLRQVMPPQPDLPEHNRI